jgi:hypothetical protein
MPARPLLALAFAAVAFLASRGALAWQEAHQTGDDVRVHVDPSGVAQVEHHVRWHVVRGPLKFVDLVGVEGAVELEPDVTVVADDGRTLTAHAIRRDEHVVRVNVDEPRSVARGNFTFDVRWRVDLVATHALSRDGATWRLAWSAPVATDGFDAARTTFELPAAPDAPVAIVADTGAVDDAAVASLKREPGEDDLELVRPHVARGEAPQWTLRIDPRAVPLIVDPVLRPPSEAKPPPEPDRIAESLVVGAVGALAILFGLAVRVRGRRYAAQAAARGARSRAVLPLPDGFRAALAGLSLGACVGLQSTGRTTVAAAFLALATLAAALRAPAGRPAVRGPGRWLVLTPDDAFPRGPHFSWRQGALGLLALSALAVVAAWAARFDAEGPWLVAMDSLCLVPLVLTGRPSQLPPDGARGAGPWLRRLHERLQGKPSLRVRPWARIPAECSRPDEVRLLVLPRAPMPGLVGVEVGMAWSQTAGGWVATPEVLARFVESSSAASRLTRELAGGRTVPGRRADERVLRLIPRRPTRDHTAALVTALARTLTDRRSELTAWTGTERRMVLAAPAAGDAPLVVTAICS